MPDNLNLVKWNFIVTITDDLKLIKEVTEQTSDETYRTVPKYYPMYFALINIFEPQPTKITLIKWYEQKYSRIIEDQFNYFYLVTEKR